MKYLPIPNYCCFGMHQLSACPIVPALHAVPSHNYATARYRVTCQQLLSILNGVYGYHITKPELEKGATIAPIVLMR